MVVTGLLMVAASIRSPIEPIFFLRTISHRPEALGLAGAAWGFGMLLGSFAAPVLARRISRERLLSGSVAVVGLCVLAASQSPVLAPVLTLWVLAGMGNAVCVVSYQTLLQERTPDALRGRVVAASEGVLDGSLIGGALLAGWIGTAAGARGAFAVSGAVFLAAAALGTRLLGHGEPAVGSAAEETAGSLGYAATPSPS
jgi:NRE family putative nickel resistance protein-like MFS transporter